MALMADPDTTSDGSETVAAPGAAGWSQEDGEVEYDTGSEPEADRESWSATWGRAGALLMVGLGVAGLIVVAHWALAKPTKPQSPTAATTSAASSAAPAGSAAAPTSIASTPDQDNKYIQALNDRGISFSNNNDAVYNGKLVCQDVDQGMTVPQIVSAFRASNPALGANATAYVAVSVRAYCPQHNDLVAGF